MKIREVTLQEACAWFEKAITGESTGKMYGYALEDTVEGYPDEWPSGSLYGVEGQFLYAMIRLTKPERVAEIGRWEGCSATHILTALSREKSGKLITVDHDDNRAKFKIDFEKRVEVIREDGIAWLRRQRDHSIDILYEDASHETAMVASVASYAKHKVAKGGWVVHHDAAHYVVGEKVRDGLARAGIISPTILLIEPSECGLAIWRNV